MPRELLPMVREALGDRYSVDEEIARGGAARVFLARTRAGEKVALKVLRPELLSSITAQRFLREIGVLARLDHPHIARLLDYGERDWLVFFVMAYFEGPTLRQYLDKVKRAALADAVSGTVDLLDALDHAHSQGIMHRDVKPENIVLSRTAGAILVDFGIARAVAVSATERVTRSGFTVGTSSYMSPEQAAGDENLDHRSDIYSAGCVLFECLSGSPPFEHADESVILGMHQRMPPPNVRDFEPSVPKRVARVVAKAMEKDPKARWQTAAAMRDALAKAQAESSRG